FTGHFKGNARSFADRLNIELDAIEFDIEDSMFIVYPQVLTDGHPSLANFIIKRKGNKNLRNRFNH
ncbi:MAG: hypothetical protein H7122_09095, partial [Chitinophagaceae bacterium]|nr:hypothetical protein [Chitinophagaceae bacterium]